MKKNCKIYSKEIFLNWENLLQTFISYRQKLPNYDDELGVNKLSVSAEGRVENQKLIQTAALLSFGWVFGFQLDSLEKNVFTLAGFTFTVSVEGWVENQKLLSSF